MTRTDGVLANFCNDEAERQRNQLSLEKPSRQPHLEHRLGKSGIADHYGILAILQPDCVPPLSLH
jgi:hypothetical protein